MEITYKRMDRELTIFLSGDLDHHAARSAMETIDKLIDQSLPVRTTLDFTALTFMDSSGIAVVLRVKRRMELMQGSLTVVNIPRQAARVLETAGLGRYINLL